MDHIYLHSIEKCVLSSILFDSTEMDNVISILNVDDFYVNAHKQIFSTMIKLHEEELPIDIDFIQKKLPKEFNENVLLDILAANPITDTTAYCYEIKENSKINKLQDLAGIISKEIHEEKKSDDVIFRIHNEIENIEQESIQEVRKTKDLIDDVLNDMKIASENSNSILGQKSGLKELDQIIGAFEDGDLIIIAARPSMGKTSIISSITIESLLENRGVLIESLEMPGKKIMSRLIAAKSGENLTDLKRGLVKSKENFQESLDFFSSKDLIIHDKTYPSLLELQSRIKIELRKNPNIKNIFVDHTGKIQLSGKTREDIEIGQVSAMLKKIARDYNIRVFLLQQLNRGVESRDDKRPLLSDIKNSGNIEEDADIVLGLYRESYYKKKKNSLYNNNVAVDAEIIVLKNRDGQIGTAKVSFEPTSARFINKKEVEVPVVEFE